MISWIDPIPNDSHKANDHSSIYTHCSDVSTKIAPDTWSAIIHKSSANIKRAKYFP